MSVQAPLTLSHLLSTKMPATSEVHTGELPREDGSEKQAEAHGAAVAVEQKNFGVFCNERGYLDQIEYIMQHGRRKGDRTGTGVISVFGSQARYSLRGLFALICFVFHVTLNCIPLNLRMRKCSGPLHK